LKIIGITGSYGKSTTKEILKLILSERYKTYATPENVNTDIGVANTILKNVSIIADVFIVEMGAYKKGEIKAICEITPPDISIITGINEQHLSLFGTIQNTLQAKYEIVEYAKKDSVVILNGDCEALIPLASDIKSKRDSMVFNVHYRGKIQRFEVYILGEHNVSNILAAVCAASEVGMSLLEISKMLKKKTKRTKIGRLVVKKSRYGYYVIDDSYNSNPDGFDAALDFFASQKGDKKVLVTIGIIELGEAVEAIYQRLAQKIVKTCNILVTTDEKLRYAVKQVKGDFPVIFDKGVKKQLDFLKNRVKKDDIVLFEGPNMRLIGEVM
jgi:UDP-N-acetylmuramoyl-tripeptide--D-alanyl-D-alanine ligase